MTALLAQVGFTPPTIEYGALSPILIVFGAATVGVLVDAFAPRRARARVQPIVALVGVVAALVAVVLLAGTQLIAAEGAIAIDGPALFVQATVLLFALVSVLLFADRTAFVAQGSSIPGSRAESAADQAGFTSTEAYPLMLFAVGGMLLFPAANDLLLLFVALEVLSLPLYLLCGLARRRRLLSQEAALKYFLLGSFSSALFLFGLALVYGFAGSVRLSDVRDAIGGGAGSDGLLLVGLALLAVGLLFKVSAAPFHSWTPDVYQGAPTPVTAFMAAATKAAAFGALIRLFYVAFGGLRWDWRPVLWAVAILTMVVGAVIAITQTDVKRMLAYSSVAHAGFLLTGVIAANQAGVSGTLFYLLGYGFATLGAFAVVTLVRDADGEATHLSRWAGLGRRSPVVAGVFALFLLALAGIPLTSGFMGKYAVFAAAAAGGAVPLVVVGVLTSAIAAFFYVRVIVLMFFQDAVPDGPLVAWPSVLTSAAIAAAVAVTVVLGVLPQSVLDLANRAAVFVR